jgi:hypothetical protein
MKPAKFAQFQPLAHSSSEWAEPKIPVTMEPFRVGRLVLTANGLNAVLELLARNDMTNEADDGTEVALDGFMQSGLICAARMLAESLSNHIADAVDFAVQQQEVNHG